MRLLNSKLHVLYFSCEELYESLPTLATGPFGLKLAGPVQADGPALIGLVHRLLPLLIGLFVFEENVEDKKEPCAGRDEEEEHGDGGITEDRK